MWVVFLGLSKIIYFSTKKSENSSINGGFLLGRCVGHEVPEVAGLHVGEDAAVADVLQVVRDVVHHLLACTQYH